MANELIEEARKLAQSFRQRAEFYAERPSVDEQKKCPTMAEITRRECLEIAVADRAAAEAVTRLCAALEARAPEGWVLVPKEPTREMILAAYQRDHDGTTSLYHKVWATMLAAAPSSPSARDVVPTDEPSELDIVQGALTLRIAQVQGLKEDNALLATVARRAESCLNTVKNDFAREKLESALAALPKRLRTRDDYPARPAPDAVDLAEGIASAAHDLYLAGRWECATVPASEQVRLWERLRDAAGIEPGTATKAGVAATTAAPAEGGGE